MAKRFGTRTSSCWTSRRSDDFAFVLSLFLLLFGLVTVGCAGSFFRFVLRSHIVDPRQKLDRVTTVNLIYLTVAIAAVACNVGCNVACADGDVEPPANQVGLPPIVPVGDEPPGFRRVFAKQITVFGLSVFATNDVTDSDVAHAAGVLAQYLDNDEDGTVDNPRVLKSLLQHRGCIMMFPDEESAARIDLHKHIAEDVWDAMVSVGLWGDETHPKGSTRGRFDATLEEVLHLVTSAGYSAAYPDVFGERAGTKIADAMDKARGGHFRQVPRSYPSSAWYTYDDRSCDYRCQVTEYFYWGLTSFLGAQDYPGRGGEIHAEWKLNTRKKLQQGDVLLYQLLTDRQYRFPSKIPDGKYRPRVND